MAVLSLGVQGALSTLCSVTRKSMAVAGTLRSVQAKGWCLADWWSECVRLVCRGTLEARTVDPVGEDLATWFC